MNERTHLPLMVLLGLAVRVPFWVEALRTPLDGDGAIIGLMARHLGQGTTMWGQPYGSPVEAWLAAPFVAALGPTTEALRLLYFLLGLALIPVAYYLGRALDPRAGLPAALLMACPPPYFLLLAAIPAPLYPTTVLLCGVMLVLVLRAEGSEGRGAPLTAGALGGLALWTHLMSTSAILAAAGYLWWRGRRRALAPFVAALAIASAPWWGRALLDRSAWRIVSVSDRQESLTQHLRAVLPVLHEPLGAVLGTHAPVVADDPEYGIELPGPLAAALILIYGISLIAAARTAPRTPPTALLFAAAALALLLFPLPVRSGPHAVRFLTLLYLPVATLVAWAAVARGHPRRAFVIVLALAVLHLLGGLRLLEAWRVADRTQPPFRLVDLGPVRQLLESHGIRRAYASYGPAYRLTYESGERIVASQPWNERFRHHPLPLLDEVRFGKNVAWVLTPDVPTDLPSPAGFESLLGAAGGRFRRDAAGPAVVYHAFEPPFAPTVSPLPRASLALPADPGAPALLRLPTPAALDGLELLAPLDGPALPRSMDVEVSADGVAFETVARRRRRQEREDLRWVNGHPQFVLDHDLIAVPLGGRTVAAVRITPVASGDPWALGDLLLHPALPPGARPPWDEWLDPSLGWRERWQALESAPRPERADWYARRQIAARHY
ncbi:MAG TPA: glycosyltransferase family 39 protein [Vicinamibacteria bacterium]